MSPWMTTAGSLKHSVSSTISGGVFSIVSSPVEAVRGDGDPVYSSPLAFTFSGGSSPGFVDGSVQGAGTINSSVTSPRADGSPVILEGDSGTLAATGALTGGGSGSVSGGVEVDSAGQAAIRSE